MFWQLFIILFMPHNRYITDFIMYRINQGISHVYTASSIDAIYQILMTSQWSNNLSRNYPFYYTNMHFKSFRLVLFLQGHYHSSWASTIIGLIQIHWSASTSPKEKLYVQFVYIMNLQMHCLLYKNSHILYITSYMCVTLNGEF